MRLLVSRESVFRTVILVGVFVAGGLGLTRARGAESPDEFADWPQFRKQVAERFEAQWPASSLGDLPSLEDISVQWATSLDSLRGRVAVTQGRKIQVRPGTQGIRLGTILEHELAHLFTFERCAAYARDPWVAELIAQLFSHDHERIRGGRFAFQADALRFVAESEAPDSLRPASDDPRWGESASRVLLSLTARGWEERPFWDAVRTCDPQRVRGSLELALNRPQPQKPARWILIESQSGAVVASEGEVERAVPLGSVLKPALVAWSGAFRKPLRSRPQNVGWACEAGAVPRQKWSWREALPASCNGFFLDSSETLTSKDLRRIEDRFRALGFRGNTQELREEAVSEWIGVRPGAEGSLHQVAELYRLLARTSPEVVEALKATPRSGTLAGLKDSRWFQSQQVALKSGTRRTPDAQPLDGWIVAVNPAWVMVMAKEGIAPRQLLAEVRARLEPWVDHAGSVLRTVEAQVLGLLPPEQLEWRCKGLLVAEVRGRATILDPSAGEFRIEGGKVLSGGRERVACFGAPLVARYLNRETQFQERSFLGDLSVNPNGPSPEGRASRGAPLRVRSIRARRGSPWVFRTTEREYLRGVLRNEAEASRPEVLKTLALVASSNARSGGEVRHPGQGRVCDSTHCQVLGGARLGGSSAREQRRLEETLSAISEESLASEVQWLPFSLGGQEPWTRDLAREFWVERLGLTQDLLRKSEATFLEFSDGQVKGKIAGVPLEDACEWFREQLQLPSCPETAELSPSGSLVLAGHGEGHGLGLDLKEAEQLAVEGRSYREILKRFFPSVRVVIRPRLESREKFVERDRP